MKKRIVKKHQRKIPKKRTSFIAIRYIVIGLFVVGVLWSGRNFFIALSHQVLGTQIGPFLADKGSDSSESTSGGDGSNSGSGDSGSNAGNGSSGESSGSSGNATTTISSPLPPQGVTPTEKPEKPESSTLEVQTEGGKGQLNLQTPGLHVEIKREDNGALTLTAHQENGTEIQLHQDALEQINEALKDKDIEVATAEGSLDALIIRKDGVSAQTSLPLSVDPTTHVLTVTTPAGSKIVAVLPDEAVQNILQTKTLTSITTQVSSTSGTTKQATLTELNNDPVFAINGLLQRRLLGLFPINLPKTAFVSATNGQIVRVDQSLATQILGALSF